MDVNIDEKDFNYDDQDVVILRGIIAEDHAKKEQSKKDTILLKPKNVEYFYLYVCTKGEAQQARPAKDISFVVEEGDDKESNLNDDGLAEGEEEYDPNQENNSANGSMSDPDDA